MKFLTLYIVLAYFCVDPYHGYRIEGEIGTLIGDVQNWATLIQNYILQLASDGIMFDKTQSLFDSAQYTVEEKDGEKLIANVEATLGDYFSRKQKAAMRIADKAVELYEKYIDMPDDDKEEVFHNAETFNDLPLDIYKDMDIPTRFPEPLKFNTYFKKKVNLNLSGVKIADEVPRSDKDAVAAVAYTRHLDTVFVKNFEQDNMLRWQYFGSKWGFHRSYPGKQWTINFAGFHNDYDPRQRPWYIAATSGPKDIVIVLDCSLSMAGKKFDIAKGVASTVINTLTKQDYVNVLCMRASHWDEVGKWHAYETDVLSCQTNRLVPATLAHRKDLKEKLKMLKPGGTSELELGFGKAFDLLRNESKTGCQSLIIFLTDGKDIDGEQVRCGPGYYTRSGYVPGPICKYNWTKVWDLVQQKNRLMMPQTRIFSYLVIDDGEELPGKLACDNIGSMKKLTDGGNLISQMNNYFDFLPKSTKGSQGLWTAPYQDASGLGLMVSYAIPAVSKKTGVTIGVAGVDATLEDIERILVNNQWGSVYSFLINKQGETIFHPLLKPSTQLVDDPIFIPVSQLEQDMKGKPTEFSLVEEEMKSGRHGFKWIEKANRGQPKGDFRDGVKTITVPATYYYGSLNESEYSFAYSVADMDKIYRRLLEPEDRSKYPTSFFNLLNEYDNSLVREKLGGVYDYLNVKYNEPAYPYLRVTHLHSSIFLAPICYCDPNKYLFDDDLATKTVNAHLFINSEGAALGCEKGGQYEKVIRADVLVTAPIEEFWKRRGFETLDKVKWTFIGMRSGVFRTYPGHRSIRNYNPIKRPWYYRAVANLGKTTLSPAYMDAAGVGKIVTISKAVYEGLVPKPESVCLNVSKTGPWPGGCICDKDEDCVSGSCYMSKVRSDEVNRCAMERVQAVTGLDIWYSDFHSHIMKTMESSNFIKSCGLRYNCPDGAFLQCETRCYIFDDYANLIVDPEFIHASDLDESKYSRVSLGSKEGEIMQELTYKHGFFRRKEQVDFQGKCSISPYSPRVTMKGLPTNPQELDDYYKNKGPIPPFNNDFGCIQDVVGFVADRNILDDNDMIVGNVSGPCMSGFYYLTALPKTNLFLLVIENYRQKETLYDFNCQITNNIVNSGAFRIINGTCAQREEVQNVPHGFIQCPELTNIELPCLFNCCQCLTFELEVFLFVLLSILFG